MDFLSVGSTEVDKENTQNFGGKPIGKCPHKHRKEDERITLRSRQVVRCEMDGIFSAGLFPTWM
jgi:hypothetical protein